MARAMHDLDVPSVIRTKLHGVRRRQMGLHFVTGLIMTLAALLMAMMGAMFIDWLMTLFDSTLRTVLTDVSLGTAGLILVLWAVRPLLARRGLSQVALDVDQAVPGLQERWSTITELSNSHDAPEILGSPSMIQKVSQEAAALDDLVSPDRVVSAAAVKHRLLLLGAATTLLLTAFLFDGRQTWVLLQRFWSPQSDYSLTNVTALPEDTTVARHEPLKIEADIQGRPRDAATLALRRPDGNIERMTLFPSTAAHTHFTYNIKSVDESFAYRVRAGDGQTSWHKVVVADRPRLTAIQFRITPPEYSRLPELHQDGLSRPCAGREQTRTPLGDQ